ncbi:MAG TPA: hypothetical protein VKF17_19245 [Isosphaeraceae bacterium]|nr:hypothetical protein [Isosphaeraceae bacterium]
MLILDDHAAHGHYSEPLATIFSPVASCHYSEPVGLPVGHRATPLRSSSPPRTLALFPPRRPGYF